jgi:hypothetical protein
MLFYNTLDGGPTVPIFYLHPAASLTGHPEFTIADGVLRCG